MNQLIVSYQKNSASLKHILFHLEECDHQFVPPLSNKINLELYSNKIKAHAETFEAWSDNRLVGFIAVYCNNVQDKIAYITNVSVVSDFSRMKIADTLLGMVEARIKELKINTIELEVDVNNLKALNLYDKHKFIKECKCKYKFKMKKIINN